MRLENKDIEEVVGEDKGEALEDVIERHKLPLFLLGAAVFLAGIGFAIVKGNNQGNQPRTTQGAGFGDGEQGVVFEAEERDKSDASKEFKSVALEEGPIFVDVAGAVERPGVYELGGGARVKDALVAAGGLAAAADREFVSKSLNLAAPIRDGVKVYIPFQSEKLKVKSQNENMSDINIAGVSMDVSGLININTASAGELEKLIGIGEVRAQQIIDNRPYSSVEELRTKGVLGEKTFEKIKEEITVY